MSVSVMIEVEDDGTVSVGTPPEEGAAAGGAPAAGGMMGMSGAEGGEEAADKSFMRPAASVDDALQIARDLLTNPQADQPTGEQNLWDRAKAARQMANQPGGRMMGKMG